MKVKCFQSLLQEVEPHVLFLVDFGFCQMGDVSILSPRGQTKLHSWPHFLGPGSSLGGKGDGWWADGVGNTQWDKEIDGSSQQPLEGRTGSGVLAKQLILRLCFLTQHPHTWSSSSCLSPGEEEEELLMEHVSKSCSAKAQPPIWKMESLVDHSHTCLSAHTSGATPFIPAG